MLPRKLSSPWLGGQLLRYDELHAARITSVRITRVLYLVVPILAREAGGYLCTSTHDTGTSSGNCLVRL